MEGTEMNSYQRVMKALEGGQPDRVPVVPIVREWCARQVGFKFSEILGSVEKYVYAQYFCMRHFGYDAVWDLLAIHAESEAMGCVLKVPEDMAPSVLDYAIKDYDKDLGKLRVLDPQKDGRLPLILEGTRRLKELCKGEYALVGFIQAPFRHASMLRGSEFVMRDVFKAPKKLKELLEIATESQIVYGQAVAEAGADIICISDPTSSGDAVSRELWEEFGHPYTSRVVHAVKKTGVKMFMHICGNTSDRLDTFVTTGVEGISLDQKVDFAHARKTVGDSVCLIGNVDPVGTLFFGKPDDVAREAEYSIRNAGQKGNFILSSGCMMPPEIPPENLQAMVDTAKRIGTYPLA
jgi:uroporphyrinogen decarboxylase